MELKKLKIENMTIKHYDEVISLWRRTELSLGASDTKPEIERLIKRNPQLCIVGYINGKVIATVMGGFDGRRGYVHHLAVDPEYQNEGYGKLMMDHLIRQFKTLRVVKIHLFVETRNKEVIEFYRSLDWTIRDDLVMMSYNPDY